MKTVENIRRVTAWANPLHSNVTYDELVSVEAPPRLGSCDRTPRVIVFDPPKRIGKAVIGEPNRYA